MPVDQYLSLSCQYFAHACARLRNQRPQTQDVEHLQVAACLPPVQLLHILPEAAQQSHPSNTMQPCIWQRHWTGMRNQPVVEAEDTVSHTVNEIAVLLSECTDVCSACQR